jgi:hypothetical protein
MIAYHVPGMYIGHVLNQQSLYLKYPVMEIVIRESAWRVIECCYSTHT